MDEQRFAQGRLKKEAMPTLIQREGILPPFYCLKHLYYIHALVLL